MNKKLKWLLLLMLALGQILIYRNYREMRFNVDLLYLVIFFFSVRYGFLKGVFSAAIIGWITDYLSGGIFGVFSFSRVLAAYLLTSVARFVDLRKNYFVFLLILFSLFLSNCVANLFFHFVFHFRITVNLIVIQPLLTAFIGTILLGSSKVKMLLNVP